MSSDIGAQLSELHDHYTFQVNLAVEEGRERDIDGLVAEFPEEAARLIRAADARLA